MESSDSTLIILAWIGWTIVNGMVAKQKGRDSSGAVVASIFLCPVFTYLYLLAVPSKPQN